MNTRAIRSTLLSTLGAAIALASGPALATTFRLTELTLDGTVSHGAAINASGQVTGLSTTAGGETHAFLWAGTTMLDLGTLGGTVSLGVDINDSGQVTGYSDTTDVPFEAPHAFLWDGTTMQDLGTLRGRSSSANAINASAQVTGTAQTAGGGTHAFLWDGTTMHDLGTLGGASSFGNAINDSGQVTGYSFTGAGTRAFLWDGTTLQNLGTLGGTSEGSAINASGQVAGYAYVTGNDEGDQHAVLWDGTTLHDLGTLGGPYGEGRAINASGQVTGWSNTAESFHAFLWDGTTMHDLGALGGRATDGYAINASGQVTGAAYSFDDASWRAFLWDGAALHDVNALIDLADPLQPFVTLEFAVDINDRGQILANGFDSRTGHRHAYLVSPIAVTVPDPRARLEALIEVVLSLKLKAAIANALDSKLQNALAALDRGHQQDGPAVGILRAFINSVEAQRGKALTTDQADQLVSSAQDIIQAL